MNSRPLRTVVVGFGRMARGYAEDAVMARFFRYAAHAQVLAEHAAFNWVAVVDPDPAAQDAARSQWRVPLAVEDLRQLGSLANDVEVLVVATPPEARVSLLDSFSALRAVLVEKPLGLTLAGSAEFLRCCRARNILVQVNLWRRADEGFRTLAHGKLQELVGAPQFGFGIYGNGLLNNGTHMVDFVRMLFGEIVSVVCVDDAPPFSAGPIPGDINPAFALSLAGGMTVSIHPVRFDQYRENGLDVWGELGRLQIYNEGLTVVHHARVENRAMTGEREIAGDAPRYLDTTIGSALYHMYTNLADAVHRKSALWSPGESALRTSAAVEAVVLAVRERRRVTINELFELTGADRTLSVAS